MSKILFKLCTIMLFAIPAFSQQKKPSVQLEIDRLYLKYKNVSSTTIYFPGGSETCILDKVLNTSGKPKEITMSGMSFDVKSVSKLISYYINQKAAKGFKEDGKFSYSGAWDSDIVESRLDRSENKCDFTFLKGNEYAVVHCEKIDPSKMLLLFDDASSGISKSKPYYRFTITIGDMRRIAGDNTKSFDF